MVETAYIQALDISVSRVTSPYAVHFIRLSLIALAASRAGDKQLISFSLRKLVCVVGFEPTAPHFQGEMSDLTDIHTDKTWPRRKESNLRWLYTDPCYHYTTTGINLVEDRRIELLLHACKAHVLPLSLIPRNLCYVLLRRTLVAV